MKDFDASNAVWSPHSDHSDHSDHSEMSDGKARGQMSHVSGSFSSHTRMPTLGDLAKQRNSLDALDAPNAHHKAVPFLRAELHPPCLQSTNSLPNELSQVPSAEPFWVDGCSPSISPLATFRNTSCRSWTLLTLPTLPTLTHSNMIRFDSFVL